MTADRARWEARYAAGGTARRTPSAWVMERCRKLPAGALVADVGAGAGRHAVPLAAQGSLVVAMDHVPRAVAAAAAGHPYVLGVAADAAALPFGRATFDAVLTVDFLDRALFPTFIELLRPGGWLVVETYMRDHARLVEQGRARGPRNPAYLLAPGELRELVAPLAVVDYREEVVRDEAGERWVAGVVAERRR